ncbi:hypothetical protein FIBSPDRAFT_947084 [Athelia psychrophila]|uniref:Uncharacterized protein n=1 Tax=Athelia psychrophila TaxID=1759441 RepID=A0A166S6Q1_9AGAM|nr:hypothetical protein FIBSPDRAFT_947084 [Fibularhizoctonia sp. CBS 109695]
MLTLSSDLRSLSTTVDLSLKRSKTLPLLISNTKKPFRDYARYLVTGSDGVYSPGVLADSEVLDRSSSSIDIPDGSRYFISALIPVYPNDVRVLLGNFMPQDPYMFFVAFGHVTSPFLYLPAFRLYVTLGPLLHHEMNFSFFRARTIIRSGQWWCAPFITLIIPHHLDFPVHLSLARRNLYQYTDRARLEDLDLPNVEIAPQVHRAWRRDVVVMGPITQIQAAMASRLEQSWKRSLRVKKEVV